MILPEDKAHIELAKRIIDYENTGVWEKPVGLIERVMEQHFKPYTLSDVIRCVKNRCTQILVQLDETGFLDDE